MVASIMTYDSIPMIFRWLLVAEQSFNPPFRRCYWLSFPHRHMSLGRSKISPSPTSSQMVSCCLTQSRLFGWSIHTSRNGWLVGDPHLLSSRPLLSSPLISSHVISSHHMSSHLISSRLISSWISICLLHCRRNITIHVFCKSSSVVGLPPSHHQLAESSWNPS